MTRKQVVRLIKLGVTPKHVETIAKNQGYLSDTLLKLASRWGIKVHTSTLLE